MDIKFYTLNISNRLQNKNIRLHKRLVLSDNDKFTNCMFSTIIDCDNDIIKLKIDLINFIQNKIKTLNFDEVVNFIISENKTLIDNNGNKYFYKPIESFYKDIFSFNDFINNKYIDIKEKEYIFCICNFNIICNYNTLEDMIEISNIYIEMIQVINFISLFLVQLYEKIFNKINILNIYNSMFSEDFFKIEFKNFIFIEEY